MKKIFRLLILTTIVIWTSCNIGLDTSNPQASSDITLSKKNNFFVSEYKLHNIDTSIFKIKEAWVEKCWKYKLNYGFKEKDQTGGYQLNLLLDNFNLMTINSGNYGTKWLMEDNLNGYFGESGNLFTLNTCLQTLPDTFKIIIQQIGNNNISTPFCHFSLIKKR